MKKSMIVDLVFSDTCYDESISLQDNEEYGKNNKEFHEICEKLCKDMSEEEKYKILWDLCMAQNGMEIAVQETFFKEGFKLGLIMGAQNFLE